MPQIIKVGQCFMELFKNNTGTVFFLRHGVYNNMCVKMTHRQVQITLFSLARPGFGSVLSTYLAMRIVNLFSGRKSGQQPDFSMIED